MLLAMILVVTGVGPRAILLGVAAAEPEGEPRRDPTLVLVSRSVLKDQGHWQLDYRLRLDHPSRLVITPGEVLIKTESWVSNSRVPGHSIPRRSSVAISGGAAPDAWADIILATDDAQHCREHVVALIWTETQAACDDKNDQVKAKTTSPAAATRLGTGKVRNAEPLSVVSLGPGEIVHVRLRMEHEHFLYGPLDPLLGVRAIEIQLGPLTFRDTAALDEERHEALPRCSWPEPPEDRRDTRYFLSSPDSLHLEAHVAGNQFYRYPELPVRYGSKLKLTFWYLIAEGTQGQCKARIAQFKDGPNSSWRVLPNGGFEECLNEVGRWVRVERVFQAESEATTLSLDFRISSIGPGTPDIGEMWIDDLKIETLNTRAAPESP